MSPLRLASQDRSDSPLFSAFLLDFRGLCPMGFLHGVNSALVRSIGRSNGDLGGANLCPHSLSSLRRLGLGRASQTT